MEMNELMGLFHNLVDAIHMLMVMFGHLAECHPSAPYLLDPDSNDCVFILFSSREVLARHRLVTKCVGMV
jgi:hypothetical protein